MTRPGPLYDRLDIETGELLAVYADGANISDKITSISIRRGGNDVTGHQPATCTVETIANLNSVPGSVLSAVIDIPVAQAIGSATATPWNTIIDRWHGRIASLTAHDTHAGRKGTTVTASAWSALLRRAKETWDPTGQLFSAALAPLGEPGWGAVIPPPVWLGDSDKWPTPTVEEDPLEPITASQLLTLLDDRLYSVVDRRDGALQVKALNLWEAQAATVAANGWPLARAHCESPATWERPVAFPTAYVVKRRLADGTEVDYWSGNNTMHIERLDWTTTISQTEQYRRGRGLFNAAGLWPWRLPKLTVRLDHLIASHFEGHRRAAGMLLNLEVNDFVPLAGDWPTAIEGLHIVTSLTERITHQGWWLDIGLAPFKLLAGNPSPAVKPRTWDQTTQTWDTPTTTWNEGVTS